jgi:CPA2 family monovalent cation:H+ antiporter-2
LVIGPSGLNLIPQERVGPLAEIGLILLLFTVGLELSPEPLVRAGRRLLMAAALQIALSTAVVAATVVAVTSLSWRAAVIVGIVAALSSTAIVLKQISDRGEAETNTSTITTGILLLQDVGMILFMLVMPFFAGSESTSLRDIVTLGLIRIVGLILLIAIARIVLPRALDFVLRRGGREMMTLFAVVAACGGAWLAGLADWTWSLGSCIAGLLLARTVVRHQLVAEIAPFQDVFNALFFISIGMLVDVSVLIQHPAAILIAVVATLLVKTLIAAVAVSASGWPLRVGLHAGLGLCTVSEFGYLLAREAERLKLLPAETLSIIVPATVGTMLLGAMLIPVAGPIAGALTRRMGVRPARDGDSPVTQPLENHVVIVGFGLNGRNISRVLRETRISHCVVEMNRSLAALAAEEGEFAVVGDATRTGILNAASLPAARALVVAINDPAATRRIVAQARGVNADVYIIARTRFVSELEELYRLGADQVIPEEFETSIEILTHVLKNLHVPDNVIEAQIEMIRAGRYGMLRGRPTTRADRMNLMHLLEATATQTFLITEDSPAIGRTIRDLNLRAATGVTIIAVVRSGRPITNPEPSQLLKAGDLLILVGTHHQLELARSALQKSTNESADAGVNPL